MMLSATEIMVQMKMVEVGIVPFTIFQHQILEALSSLSPKQQREVKRKFRKMWRKAYKSLPPIHGAAKGSTPSRSEICRRRYAVYHMFERATRDDNTSD